MLFRLPVILAQTFVKVVGAYVYPVLSFYNLLLY